MGRDAGSAEFDDFVHAQVAALGRHAYLLTCDSHLAEDLVHSALERAAVRWDRLDEPAAYVRRVLYTQAVSWWRARRRRVPEILVDSPPDRPPTLAGDPDLRIVLEQALARLTPKQRAVLVLRFYEDMSERRRPGCYRWVWGP